MPSVGTIGGAIAVSFLCLALVFACHHDVAKKVAPPPPAPIVHVAPKATSTPFHCHFFHCAVPLPKAKPVVAAPKVTPPPAPAPKAAQAPTPMKPSDFCTQVKLVVAEHGEAWTLARAKELNYTAAQIAAAKKCFK